MDRSFLSSIQRMVIKIGTSVLSYQDGLNSAFIAGMAGQIATVRKSCPELVLVSSGAIGLGQQQLGIRTAITDVRMRQACASVGQPLLMHAYRQIFEQHHITISQVLLTRAVFDDRQSYLNLRNNVETLLSLSVLPIMNENDSVSTREIGKSFGDNDSLSAMVASKLDAQLLLILTDVDNLYTRDPNRYDNAEPLSYIPHLSQEIRDAAGGAGKLGTGGMQSKLEAVDIASTSGCYTIIANARQDRIVERILAGEELGTLFAPQKKLKNRSRWILHSMPSGSITADAGALAAVRSNKNLLISGVSAVQGDFNAGDVVTLNDCARMVSLFGSHELQTMLGKHSSEVERIAGKGRRVLARADDIVFIEDDVKE